MNNSKIYSNIRFSTNFRIKYKWEYPHGVMIKTLNYGIVVSEFKLQLSYYVHFRTNTLEKGMNLLFSQLWVK